MALFLNTTELVANDQRKYIRAQTRIVGNLSILSSAFSCCVVDLSASGAGLVFDTEGPQPDMVGLLAIDGFGDFDGLTMRYSGSVLGFRFLVGEAERHHLLAKLTVLAAEGFRSLNQLRECKRWPSMAQLCWTRSTGEKESCRVLNISLRGVSLESSVRPPVGEFLHLGMTYGRVIRHHEEGIAVQFLPEQ